MTQGKGELEKALKLSKKLKKEMTAITDWMSHIDRELTKRETITAPRNIDEGTDWIRVKLLLLLRFPKSHFLGSMQYCLQVALCGPIGQNDTSFFLGIYTGQISVIFYNIFDLILWFTLEGNI